MSEIQVQEMDYKKATKEQLIKLLEEKQQQLDQLHNRIKEIHEDQKMYDERSQQMQKHYTGIINQLKRAFQNVEKINRRRLEHIQEFCSMSLLDVLEGVEQEANDGN